jgi:fructose-bisphosphate aldolase class II
VGLTIQQIRENNIKARHLMKRSRQMHFAVGAFNIDNQETLIAVARALKAQNSPAMVEVSHGEVTALGHENVRNMVDNYKRQLGIELYINLDHSPTFEDARKGIDAGFEFIHIDISQANHDASDEEIIAETKKVVDYAKFTGALVESEPHYFAGGSNVFKEKIDYDEIRKTFSTPEGAHKFVEATGIDTFAAAVGNLHGKYDVPKELDLELLQEIRDAIDCNISLHGGSDTPGHYFEEAAKIGVSKININSDLRYTFRSVLEKEMKEHPDQFAVMKLMDKVKDALQEVVETKIKMFNSSGKAVV